MTYEIYLDSNATSPVMPAACEAAANAMRDGYGNPSSTHATGLRARAVIDCVRARARRVLGAPSGKVIFTSGATEAIQTAVLSALCAVRARQAAGEAVGSLLLYGVTEHKAVPQALAHWNAVLGTGLELRSLPVDGDGQHLIGELRALAPQAAMVCTMAANNETGVITDLGAIGAVLEECAPRALWMVDCVQALGKLPLQLSASRIDYAPFSGHKLYAPKGIGMLYVREGAPFTALCMGGGQEAGDRSGTENVPGIAALGAVLEALEGGGTFRTHDHMLAMRERLAQALRDAFPGIVFNAPFERALPTTLNFAVPSVASKELLDLFDAASVRVSAGSACSAASAAPSYVLEAMGVEDWRARASVRMSFGPMASDEFIGAACERIARCGEALRASGIGMGVRASLALPLVTHLGSNSWIIAEGGECIVIDPALAHCQRIGELVEASRCQVRAIVLTEATPEAVAARARLESLRGAGSVECDSSGWPVESAPIELADGTMAESLALDEHRLVRQRAGGRTVYLLGTARSARLDGTAIRYAFAADRALDAGVAGRIGSATLLCCNRPDELPYATTVAAADHASLSGLMQLDATALERFIASHPDARMIDVREHYEFIAGPPPSCGVTVENIPVSQLASHIPGWLAGEQRPLVVYCRSGVRSARVARCLHRLGYRNAWQLSGGVALGGPLFAAA